MGSVRPDWKTYELFVAQLLVNEASTSYCITANARIKGRISGIRRQIDVLIDCRHDSDDSNRIIVDAKRRRRKVDVPQVEAFEGLMRDVGAAHGYLVCPMGHTHAAQKRADSSISIRLLPLDQLGCFDPGTWPKCLHKACSEGRVLWDGFPATTLRLAPLSGVNPIAADYIHHVGKCIVCRRFHVLCITCKKLFILEDEDEHQCKCKLPWFWLSSVEDDDLNVQAVELHLVSGLGDIMTVNRKPA